MQPLAARLLAWRALRRALRQQAAQFALVVASLSPSSLEIDNFYHYELRFEKVCGLLGSKGVGSGEGKLGDLERTLSKIYRLPTLSLEGKNSNFAPFQGLLLDVGEGKLGYSVP